ncbi:hypothetical protein GCM10017788_77770 [Amycolatopsis acidiphila]|nr:hypothetical protein GCM10017788_77770 [Amycolatopsis acidiphila]
MFTTDTLTRPRRLWWRPVGSIKTPGDGATPLLMTIEEARQTLRVSRWSIYLSAYPKRSANHT